MEWHGVLLPRDGYNPEVVRARDELADAAKAGAWDEVFTILDGGRGLLAPDANDWRVGGSSWFSPLHQAAWTGAPESVVRELVRRGALRTLRDSTGRRPLDIARERGNGDLIDALTPTFAHALLPDRIQAMNVRLAELVTDTVEGVLDPAVRIRHVDVAGLAETGAEFGFTIPGMYGGFRIELFRSRLHVESWSRVVGGSGRAFVITAERTTLVDEGFV